MSSGFLDFHSHILPDMDDGAVYPDESIQLLLAEKRAGVSDVCLTPHYYAEDESVSSFLTRRQRSYAALREAKNHSRRSFPALHLGAEVHYFEGMAEEPLLELLCCGASRLLLVEPPMSRWSDLFYNELSSIRQKRDLQPVIAHLDRYIAFFDEPQLLRKMRERGCWIQFNAGSFLSGSHTKLMFDFFQSGEVYFLGSDCHNLTDRPCNMRALVSAFKKEKLVDRYLSFSRSGIALIKGKRRI